MHGRTMWCQMGACRFLHWLPPDDGTGKYSFTKKHCAQHYIAYSDNRNATLKLSLLKTVNSIQLQKATQCNYRSRTTGVGGSPRPSQLLKHTQSYDYRRWWVYDGILYQIKQRAGVWGITAENMEKKSQHTNFNEDTTNEALVGLY